MRIHGVCKVLAVAPGSFIVNSGVFQSVERLAAGQYRVTLKEAVDPSESVIVGSMDHDMLVSTAGIGITPAGDTQYTVTMGGAAPVDANFSLIIVALL